MFQFSFSYVALLYEFIGGLHCAALLWCRAQLTQLSPSCLHTLTYWMGCTTWWKCSWAWHRKMTYIVLFFFTLHLIFKFSVWVSALTQNKWSITVNLIWLPSYPDSSRLLSVSSLYELACYLSPEVKCYTAEAVRATLSGIQIAWHVLASFLKETVFSEVSPFSLFLPVTLADEDDRGINLDDCLPTAAKLPRGWDVPPCLRWENSRYVYMEPNFPITIVFF